MPQSSTEKRDRFVRIFPPRVERLVDQLRKLENCTNRSNYEWDEDMVKRAWIEIAKAFRYSANAYGIDLQISLDGEEVQNINTQSAVPDRLAGE